MLRWMRFRYILARAQKCRAQRVTHLNFQHMKYSSEAAKYEKKSPLEHVLLRPDTYIGGTGIRENWRTWLSENGRMVAKMVSYPPGLLKIFDEILVNSADNKQRDAEGMTRLAVEIDKTTSRISIWNNGKGLPVDIHPSEGVYVPTLVFGSLFTSSNYDDNEIKTVGGRNGYGAKLCNIFSTEFVVETVDSARGKRFRQKWYHNMQKFDKPEVKDVENLEDYTKVSFIPDLRRFNVTHFNDDILALFEKRVNDVAATLPQDVEVILNGRRIGISEKGGGFQEYVKRFLPEDSEKTRPCFMHPVDRWNIAVVKRKFDGYEDFHLPGMVTFVNNIFTEKGGTHVDYIFEKIVAVLKKLIDEKLDSKTSGVKPMMIKQNLSIFANCLIENPSFESQTKEMLTTKPKFFGSSFEVDSKKLIDWANSSGFVEDIIEQVVNTKKAKTVTKNRRGTLETVRDIVKLEDATWAGHPVKGKDCTLILTEGDSAKALALAGLEVLGRDNFGVFPLKGKLANVSHLDEKRAAKNEEISNLMRCLGLKFGAKIDDYVGLRYGKVMILADQDEDGSHIKGLIINFLHKFWPELIQKFEFIYSFRTPLLKAKKGKEIYSFFNHSDFNQWAKSEADSKFTVKYYKGLGTSTSDEARNYFSNLEHHTIEFKYKDDEDDDAIRMAFDREKSEERKHWIRRLEANEEEHVGNQMRFKEFVDGELLRFGVIDLRRSIPCLIDGLKPSQRKVLWTMLTTDNAKEMKVSQLAGAVAHSQSYHHGEESLVGTIVRMGQTFCGASSSNLSLIQPIGQFGTRHEGGHDAASARYIFTALEPITRLIFPEPDDKLLERRIEDGRTVEPKWLCPIIPLVLVNGAEGIGTGWATKIAQRNPLDILNQTRKMIESHGELNDAIFSFYPFFADFQGTVDEMTNGRYVTKGRVQVLRPERRNTAHFCVEITELPIGCWTSKYKERLTQILDGLQAIRFSEHHTEKRVNFQMTFDRKSGAQKILKMTNSELLQFFKLRSTITENLVLFDGTKREKLSEFSSVSEIFQRFFEVRKELYRNRLKMQTMEAEKKLKFVQNQIKFIENVTSGVLDLRKMTSEILNHKLREMKFDCDSLVTSGNKSNFAYLLEMPLSRLTAEEMAKLLEKRERRIKELEIFRNSQWDHVWIYELSKLETAILRKIKTETFTPNGKR